MVDAKRQIAIIGRLGIHPMTPLALPARRVLAYLALRGQPLERSVAAADLWPDLPEDVGRANLRRALWQVPRGWVTAIRDELVLEADSDFTRAHGVAARALNGDPLTFEEITLLSSDVLPGWHEEWVVSANETFRLLRVQALEAACRTMAVSGNHALATQAGAAAVAAEPLRESAVEALILAHLAQRNRFQAAQCFNALTRRLHDELGVPPDPALKKRLVSIGLAVR